MKPWNKYFTSVAGHKREGSDSLELFPSPVLEVEEPKVAVMVELVLRMTGELAPKHPHLTPTLGQGHSLHNTAQGSHKTSQNRVAGEPPPRPPPPPLHTHILLWLHSTRVQQKPQRTEWLETPPPHTHTHPAVTTQHTGPKEPHRTEWLENSPRKYPHPDLTTQFSTWVPQNLKEQRLENSWVQLNLTDRLQNSPPPHPQLTAMSD